MSSTSQAKAAKKELEVDSIEELRAAQVSLTKQISALKGMDDGRSQRALHDLHTELTDVRHRITLCKPPSQQVQVLEAAITKKKLELVQAKEKRDAFTALMRDLHLEIIGAETQLAKAQQDL
eukprot:5076762-Karenia_brevis.AAC.1